MFVNDSYCVRYMSDVREENHIIENNINVKFRSFLYITFLISQINISRHFQTIEKISEALLRLVWKQTHFKYINEYAWIECNLHNNFLSWCTTAALVRNNSYCQILIIKLPMCSVHLRTLYISLNKIKQVTHLETIDSKHGGL